MTITTRQQNGITVYHVEGEDGLLYAAARLLNGPWTVARQSIARPRMRLNPMSFGSTVALTRAVPAFRDLPLLLQKEG